MGPTREWRSPQHDLPCHTEQIYVSKGEVLIATSPTGCKRVGHVWCFGTHLCVTHLFEYIRLRREIDGQPEANRHPSQVS